MELWITLANPDMPPGAIFAMFTVLCGVFICMMAFTSGTPTLAISGVIFIGLGVFQLSTVGPDPDFITENVVTYLEQEHDLTVSGDATYDEDDESVTAHVTRPDGTSTNVTVTWYPLANAPESASERRALPADFNPITLTFADGVTTPPAEDGTQPAAQPTSEPAPAGEPVAVPAPTS